MADRLFRLPFLICCDTCSKEWFGAQGEEIARDHAKRTGHQVRVNVLLRETLNEVSEGIPEEFVSRLDPSTPNERLSREAAIARLAGIYGVAP